MVEKFNINDLDIILDIWLNGNLDAHNFINKKYFYDNLDYVKEILPKSEIYILKEDNIIKGFIGLNKGYIEGLFIKREYRNQGIGKILIDKAKSLYNVLSLSVYEKNKKALEFYLKRGFEIKEKHIDEDTMELELLLKYKKM
ncbi:GNAT family N-acetyltransferase [Anaerofustis butyriciformans]|uniref:GNAT family N-acetyltransferase n=1 Tax=Anaerofustis TaxID=264995 RepID=UPI003F891B1B